MHPTFAQGLYLKNLDLDMMNFTLLKQTSVIMFLWHISLSTLLYFQWPSFHFVSTVQLLHKQVDS